MRKLRAPKTRKRVLGARRGLRGPETPSGVPGDPLTEGIVSPTNVRTGGGNGMPDDKSPGMIGR